MDWYFLQSQFAYKGHSKLYIFFLHSVQFDMTLYGLLLRLLYFEGHLGHSSNLSQLVSVRIYSSTCEMFLYCHLYSSKKCEIKFIAIMSGKQKSMSILLTRVKDILYLVLKRTIF